MQAREFVAYHSAALAREEARHNLILAIMARLAGEEQPDIRCWTLGGAGQCAVQSLPFPIVLGDLDEPQCGALAEQVRGLDYSGVVGPDLTAKHFARRAAELGIAFFDPIPQQIQALSGKPRYPGSPGHARRVEASDAWLFVEWIAAFMREAIPHDPPPDRARLNA